MANHWGRGDKGIATQLHSKIIRAKGECEKCGEKQYDKLQCAHIISRRYAHTRTDEANAFCLCAKCHYYFTVSPVEFAKFVFEKIGEEAYEDLLRKSQLTTKVDWTQEKERLRTIAEPLLS
jgi:hypothetical protein